MLKCFKINIFLLIILFFGIIFTSPAQAQTPQQIIDSIQNNIQVSIVPESPVAGGSVTIHLTSYNTPLDQATISYTVNGKVLGKGLGLTDFTTTAGAVGSSLKILISIVTAGGQTFQKTLAIQPADIDLIWQASSYVPPFYQGKALYPHQGLITFTAIPNVSANGNVAKSIGTYTYTWKKDGDVLSDFSGYGKSTFSLRGTIISRPFTIAVDVSTAQGVLIGQATATVQPQVPQIAFYENNPLLGVLYNKNLKNITMQGKELSISAVPYFFNAGNEPAALQYKWTMNGQSIVSQIDPSILTVRNDNSASGKTSISLQISNTLAILQTAANSMYITLSQPNQNSL